MTPALTTTSDGVAFRVKCRPGSPSTRERGLHDGALRVDVAAPPEDGAANDALIRWLAKTLGLPRASISISAGASSREKSLRISGITKADAEARFQLAFERRGDAE